MMAAFDNWYNRLVSDAKPVHLTIETTCNRIAVSGLTRENALKTLKDCVLCLDVRLVYIVSGCDIATVRLCNWGDELDNVLSVNSDWYVDGAYRYGKDVDGDPQCVIDRRY